MLATSGYPTLWPAQQPVEDSKYQPAKDNDAFNSLLPPPVEFIEGSSSSALAVPEGKYEPINVVQKARKPELSQQSISAPVVSKAASSPKPPNNTQKPSHGKARSLYTGPVDTTWPDVAGMSGRGSGLYNTGNTCFLNSALQCLMHTPPLIRMIFAHKGQCQTKNGFCMSCSLHDTMVNSLTSKGRPFTPSLITNKLQVIAKHMRRGRQEDSHEFLRYAIDGLQKSCLTGLPPKLDPKIAETTWVHKIFGGKLRSRVTCSQCGYNSDTFDSILDLSLDIMNTPSVQEALRKFVLPDYLKGANKYKCEKCKKHVSAEKKFTIHDAPAVLTVHLKRFSPLGKKIGHLVKYSEKLQLKPFMSDGQFGPNYTLFGVICHAGGGPNSGHYYAHVKSKQGRWWEMNDELVSENHQGAPLNIKSAYMLFYLRDKGQGLDAAISSSGVKSNGASETPKKRKAEDDGEQSGPRRGSFIGPQIPAGLTPPSVKRQKSEPDKDPQSVAVKKRIAAARRLKSLTDYGSDSDDEGVPVVAKTGVVSLNSTPIRPSASETDTTKPPSTSTPLSPKPSSSLVNSPSSPNTSSSAAREFSKKHDSPNHISRNNNPRSVFTPGGASTPRKLFKSPFGGGRFGNTLNKHKKRRNRLKPL